MPSSRPRALLTALAALTPALAGCVAAKTDSVRNVVDMVRQGQYAEARDRARELAAERPDDPELQRLARDAEVAYILDIGRATVFAGDPENGLARFEQAALVDPSNPVVQNWILKTHIQLAEESADRASERLARDDLDGAQKAYEAVLMHLPETRLGQRVENIRELAQLGLAGVLLMKNYRSGMSRSYYEDGMEQFRDYYLPGAARDLGLSLEYDEEFMEAETRRREAKDLLSAQRLSQARSLEEEGLFYAAANEYRIVLIGDPSNEEARAGRDRMDREARAYRLLREAEMNLRRGEVDKAQEILDSVGQLAQQQEDFVGRITAGIDDARMSAIYDTARALERDYRFADALQVYTELLEQVEFFEDAIARRETLAEFVRLAAVYYETALAAESDAEAAEYLRRIPIFWPEYRDVDARLAEIEARLPPEELPGFEEVEPMDPAAEGEPTMEGEPAVAPEEIPVPPTDEDPTGDDGGDGDAEGEGAGAGEGEGEEEGEEEGEGAGEDEGEDEGEDAGEDDEVPEGEEPGDGA
jgi:tetratricopeptide (TPR) repeat protein